MRPNGLLEFCSAIESTSLSMYIQSTPWVVPVAQIVHLFAIAVILISTLTAILYATRSSQFSMSPLNLWRFKKYMYVSLAILFFSGAILIIGEPARSLANSAFQLKMLFLVTALTLTLFLFKRIRESQTTPRILCLISLVMWMGVVFSGRWIAYV